MKASVIALAIGFGLGAPVVLKAQEPPKAAEATKEHEWLHQLVGKWESENEATVAPGQPPVKCKGTIDSRKLGELWVVSEFSMDMPGMAISAVQTLGYDAKTKKYVGTWVDSMMDHMWKYEGTVDSTGKILTLEAEGPSITGDSKSTKYRDVYEFKSKDHVVLTSSALGDDGKWVIFMTGNVRRVK
jgi:hypothetical protein